MDSRRFTALLLAALMLFAGRAPVFAMELPSQVQDLLKADKECNNAEDNHMKQARETAALDENNTLYLVPCFSGAYNIIYRVYVFDKRYPEEVRPSAFAGFSDEMGWYGQIQLINAFFDTKTKTLTAFEKGRGLGDCGSVPTYKWAEYGWRMMEYRYWGKCDGSRMPEKWPVIYKYEGKQ